MRYIIWTLILTTTFLSGCDTNSYKSYKHKGGKPRPMNPEAKKVLVAFKSAVSASDWQQVLSFCTPPIRTKADKYASTAEFCRTVLPVKEIKACKRFNTYVSQSIRSGDEVEDVEYRWSVSLKGSDNVYWFASVRKEDTRWILDFPAEPLSKYVDKTLAERKRQAEEYQRRRQALLPKLRKVSLTLTPLKSSFALGEPMPFRLEMTNGGRQTLYYDDQQAEVNNSMIIRDSKGRVIAYTAGPFQTGGAYRPIEAGRTVVLFDGFDLTSQYRIKRPGTYTVQFSGSGLSVGDKEEDDPTKYAEDEPSFVVSGICASNTVKINVVRARR